MINFFRSPFFLPWFYPQLTWRIPTEDKELYLTFDDGPVPGVTDFVIDTLGQYKIPATFFCIGDNVQKHPAVFRRIIDSGHAIGNHTYNHLSGWKTSTKSYLKNIDLCDVVIAPSIVNPEYRKLFRPPYGRIKRSQIQSLGNYEIVMWDVLTHDYARSLSPAKCLAGSITAARPGSIVVFHDSYKAERNMTYTLPRFIDHFINQGYAFKSLR